ncbi:PREDICTED: uncharacterized protein LOC107358864 [Acropora digitifera]|uniref:uncharacterized protein LOC107358864 n=1 Tax=Acropora digitifera TaxID=70779 RepID=UPI00077AD3B6|nr:PREDICTED: uncharacterized protein LOC107358864 [Acropora digitifera]XP_015780923.1 PREDICTED: uncharacterized protein LOC107358864 [Acropora digitifera]
MIGYTPKEHLEYPPDDLDIDVLIIHSCESDLGRQAQGIQGTKNCTWVQVVHTVSQELAKHEQNKIHDQDHDHEVQLDLCKRADMIIAIGPKVAEAYRNYLAFPRKYVFDLTPGIAHDLKDVRPVVEYGEIFRILVSATYYEKYFEAKGLDIAAKAIKLLPNTSYRILFLVKPNEDSEKLESRLETHLDKKQFTVERFEKNTDDLKTLLCRVQLAILPSREEGFGTSILPALSAAVPVLISGNTGLGMAVKELSSGPKYIIYSDEPEVWAKKIEEVRKKGAGRCSEDAKKLRKEYMAKYSTQEQCHALVKKMRELFADKQAPSLSKAKDDDKLNVTLVTNDEGWKITVTDQLLTGLAKDPSVKLSGLVGKTNPEVEAWAKKLNMNLLTPKEMIGYSPKERLEYPPDDLDIDVLIIHFFGSDLLRQAQTIEGPKKCTWVQVVHTVSQELAKYGEKKIHQHDHKVQLDLCKRADMIIAIGPKVAEAYRNYLAFSRKYVFDLTPGIAHDLKDVRPVVEYGEIFRILVSAIYYEKYFEAKGLDIAAKAIKLLPNTSYRILFLVKPNEDSEKLESRLETHLDKKQFTVERFEKNTENFKTLLCRVQLAILPSREEGFGTSILPALSAAVPVLISGNTGLGMAVKELSSGPKYIIYSDEPEVWAKKIEEVRKKGAGRCSEDAKKLRKEYMAKYSTQEQCHALVKKMRELSADKQGDTQDTTKVEGCDDVDAGKKNRSGKKFCMLS